MINQRTLFELTPQSTAQFSSCRQYRYTLWRTVGNSENYVNFIGLNPSTADEIKNDNTISKCISYARRWGYGRLCMTNLFAYRATDPRIMKLAPEPVGEENDKYLIEIARNAGLVIAAWSIHGSFRNRDEKVRKLLKRDLFCIGKTVDGHPWHPLYKSGALTPQPFV